MRLPQFIPMGYKRWVLGSRARQPASQPFLPFAKRPDWTPPRPYLRRHEVSITDKSSFRNTMVWSGAGGKGPDRGAAGKGDRGDRLGNPAFEHPGAPGGHYSRGGKGGDRGGNPAFEQQASGGDRWGASGLRGGGFEGGKGWAKDTAASRDLNAKWR